MACSDWRVMLSLERRTASSPCIIDSSRLLACCPSVSESARTWFSMAYVSARAFSLTALSMATVERIIASSKRDRRSAKAASSARVRSTSWMSSASARLASVASSATV